MRGFLAALVVLLLLGGGYYGYTHYYMPMKYAKMMKAGGAEGGGPPDGKEGGGPPPWVKAGKKGGKDAGPPPEVLAMMMTPEVDVALPLQKEVTLWHEFSGRLMATDYAEVRPQVSGEIIKVHFQDGAVTPAGAPLFTIDPRPYQAALDSAKADVLRAQNDFSRAQRLFKEKAISKADIDQRSSGLQAAKAALTMAELNIEYTQVKAPFAGRLGRAEITEGNVVQAGMNAPVLTTIAAQTPIYADFDMDEGTYLQYVKAGASVEIPVEMGLTTDSGTPRTGKIFSFDNAVNPASGTIRARAVFDNADGALVPGLFARIRIAAPAPEQVLLVTDRAIGTDQSKKTLLVVGAENKVEYREVTLGDMVDGLVVIRSGLTVTDQVIVSGLQKARPGSGVKPKTVTMIEADNPPPPPAMGPPQ